MSSFQETLKGEIRCPDCDQCNPWILRVCADCEKKSWINRKRVNRWCDNCFVDHSELISRLLLVNGFEWEGSLSFNQKQEDWQGYINHRSRVILWLNSCCGNRVSVPQTWVVHHDKWEETKRLCQKRKTKKQKRNLQSWAKN